MYIQITTNCNMACAHCGYSCSSRKKEFITMDAFKEAVKISHEYAMYISIGGGEPTCHPDFWNMLFHAIVEADEETTVWLATNGKKTQDALKLAKLAKNGVISCDLSQDIYHEPIDPIVVKAFNDRRREYSGISIRNTSAMGSVIYAGRAKRLDEAVRGSCICEDMFIAPNGDAYSCGCKKHNFGNILEEGFSMEDVNEWYESRGASIGDCVFCR